MYKTILESDGKGQKSNELLYQKRFENYELQNLPNSHASVASHVQSSSQGGGPGGSAVSAASFMTSKREKDKEKKTKVMQKILHDDSPEYDHDQEPMLERDSCSSIINENNFTEASSPEVKNKKKNCLAFVSRKNFTKITFNSLRFYT